MSKEYNNSLLSFFERCSEIRTSVNQCYFCNTKSSMDSKQILKYSNGIILGLYRNNDSELRSIINEGCSVKSKELYDFICNDVKIQNKKFRDWYKQIGKLELFKPTSFPAPNSNLVSWVKDYNMYIIKDLIDSDEEDRIIAKFLLVYFTFKNYIQKEKISSCFNLPAINKLYQNNIFDKDFTKWNLIPINNQRELLPIDPPRIYDKVINKTIMTDHSVTFAKIIIKLFNEGKIDTLAIRGNNTVYDGLCEKQRLWEAIERGKCFELNIITLPDITKLYDEKIYDDQLWISKTDKDITFEELCSDFDIVQDAIETQVIHLQYEETNDGYIITHLDHEKVYYTVPEFELRQKQCTKGTAYKRIKTFKINNASIPFEYMCKVIIPDDKKEEYEEKEIPFILFILNCFFNHKNLISEYFQNLK